MLRHQRMRERALARRKEEEEEEEEEEEVIKYNKSIIFRN